MEIGPEEVTWLQEYEWKKSPKNETSPHVSETVGTWLIYTANTKYEYEFILQRACELFQRLNPVFQYSFFPPFFVIFFHKFPAFYPWHC